VLSLLKPRSYSSGGFDVGGELSIQFRQYEGIKCYAMASGQCWLSVEGVPDAVHVKAGDCFLLPSGRPFRLATDLTLTPIDARTIFADGEEWCHLLVQGRRGLLYCRRALRLYRQSCRHPVGGAAAHRAYPDRIG